MNLFQKVKENLQGNQLFGRSATVIVGVSGGPDSTALAHILHQLQYELGFHLHIAHYNHNLRRSAHADQKFVEQLAVQLNVPCTVGVWKNSKQLKKGSIEDAARRHRFQFFKNLAKKINAGAVVLAHTQDDLAETVMMRILRGAGLQGLRGILKQRKIEGICFVRPMLKIKKEDILLFLKKKDLPYRSDSTNKQTRYFRNKVRLELLPLLQKRYNQNITELLTNLANNSYTDYDYLENQARKLFERIVDPSVNHKSVRIHLKPFITQHPAMKRMVIRAGIERLKGDTKDLTLAHFREIEDLLLNRPQKSVVHLPKKIFVRKDARHLILAYK